MKITNVEAFAIKIPREAGSPEALGGSGARGASSVPGGSAGPAGPAGPGASSAYFVPVNRHALKSNMHETLVVRITTDGGLVGYGEGQSCVSPDTPRTIVDDLCRPMLVGEDPFDVEFLWQRLFEGMRERGHPTGFYVDALAACDIALWDLQGKALNLPVHKLLGGRFRDRIELYAGCAGRDPDAAADRAERLVAAGYRGMKLSPASDRRGTVAIAAAVRDRVGPDIAVMVDVHTEFDVAEAIRLGRELEALDIYWLEAPTLPEDLAGHAAVTRALDMHVANGEWYRTRYEMKEAFDKRTCDVVMPDIGRTGLTEGKRIAVLADTYNIPVSPHIGGGGLLSIAATIQLSAAIPNFLVMEHGHESYPTRCRYALEAPQPVDGAFPVTDQPGLGVRIDDEALERFSNTA